jgi:DNA replication protein DnaC
MGHTREEAEALLRQVGITPEYTGEAAWELAVTDQMRQAERASRSQSNDLRRAFEPLSEEETKHFLERLRERAKNYPEFEPAPLDEYATDCAICGGARFVRVTRDRNHPLFGKVERCVCVGGVTPEERLFRADIPMHYRAMTFESFDRDQNPDAFAAVVAWNGQTNRMLAGPPGRGKTHLAVAALQREVVERERVGRFIYVPHMLEEIRRRYSSTEETAQDYIDRLVGWPLLVLDDLGAERATEWVTEQMVTLIERRLQAGSPTLITSNLMSREAISEHYGGGIAGERLASRLGPGVYGWIAATGEDQREYEQQPAEAAPWWGER